MEEGWRATYSDGSGAEGHAASTAHVMTRAEPERTLSSSSYLGTIATPGDAELQGLLLALQLTSGLDQVLLLSDSLQASIACLHKLAQGTQSPRSGIEVRIKRALRQRGSSQMDTGTSWVRAHIGINGNEKADTEAGIRSHLGQLLSEPGTATEAGIRQLSKQARAAHRSTPSLGLGKRTMWPRQPLSAYTWMRTNRGPGPMRALEPGSTKLARQTALNVQPAPTTQYGRHIVFHCPALTQQRNRLIGAREVDDREWADLDRPILIRDTQSPNEYRDGVQDFFHVIFNLFH